MNTPSSRAVRTAYAGGATAFANLAAQVPADSWSKPGLGVWTVRDLVGHLSRAFLTVETYLAGTPGTERLDGPVAYFLATKAALADADAVAQRGRDAGAALGDDPASRVKELSTRVVALVDASADDAPVATPVGTMTLVDYLPTRSFELAVHGLDLARALGVEAPEALTPAVRSACALAGALGGELPTAADLLLALTGRTELPAGLSVV